MQDKKLILYELKTNQFAINRESINIFDCYEISKANEEN